MSSRYWHVRVMWTWGSKGFSKVEQGHDRGKPIDSSSLVQEPAEWVGSMGEHDRAGPCHALHGLTSTYKLSIS